MPGKSTTLYIDRRILNMKSAFQHKLLCDGPTFSAGDSCRMQCSFCYVESIFARDAKIQGALAAAGTTFDQTIIRRNNPVQQLPDQLLKNGKPRYTNPSDTRVIYASPLVDVAANVEMARETIAICRVILQNTHWQIRLLSKSNLLTIVATALTEFKERIIFGFSTGTPNDQLASAFEKGTAKVSRRIAALRMLQNEGYRTFGMICPSLPQNSDADYDAMSSTIVEMIGLEHCQHVWAEVMNVRGQALTNTCNALNAAGFHEQAQRLHHVSRNQAAWEQYARATYRAHVRVIPPEKLRFLQYVSRETKSWWADQPGAVLLGKAAHDSSPSLTF
jgi:DNA repair photolyase